MTGVERFRCLRQGHVIIAIQRLCPRQNQLRRALMCRPIDQEAQGGTQAGMIRDQIERPVLEPRIEQAGRGELSGKSLDEIRREERKRAGV